MSGDSGGRGKRAAARKADRSGTGPGGPPDPELLRVGPDFRLADVDPRSTPGFAGDKAAGTAALQGIGLDEPQELLYANGRAGEAPAVLLVLQGMDTSGKGGIIRHVVGAMDPQGVRIASFKRPTEEELAHDFLWRIEKRLPEPGMIGVFDRSHYEDVLVQRVRSLAAPEEIERRYGAIVDWERELAGRGTRVLKVMLHISEEEQGARLLERLDRPDKHWKYNPGDLDERALWPEYQRAYQIALERTSFDHAPWYCVPADRKWYARLAVAALLHRELTGLGLAWPPADFDVERERARLAAA